MGEYLFPAKAIDALDTVIPAHAFGANTYTRAWTTPAGVFSLVVEPGTEARVTFDGGRWSVAVPITAAGLDALTVVMVLAGAIDLPDNEVEEIAVDAARVHIRWGGLDTVLSSGVAVAVGAALVDRASRIPGRYR